MKHTYTYSKGFTIVEMLVSIALFSIVATMSVGSLLILIEANGRAQSMQLVMTNLSFAFDSMTRELRTGFNWYCTAYTGTGFPSSIAGSDRSDCTGSNNNVISVVESGTNTTCGDSLPCSTAFDDRRITYWLDTDADGQGTIYRRLGQASGNPANDWVALTGSDVDVDTFAVTVAGAATVGDNEQPRATLYLEGQAGAIAGELQNRREFSLQTTVVQRFLDL